MTQTSELKEKVLRSIDNHRGMIVGFGEEILRTPELGFKEYETSRKLAEKLEELGLSVWTGLALTGVKARIKGKMPGCSVAVIGELDGIICPQAKFAHPETGAAHVCGHNAQLAAMVGVVVGLVESGVMNSLNGEVVFLGTPAEEYVEMAFREKLYQSKKIRFLGGKQELISRGEFDDVDMAMMVHALPNCPRRVAEVDTSMNGFMAKKVDFIGKPAHAGMAPHEGINALNAASLGIMGVNMQRETFKDEDYTRVHYIITECGKSVNIIPDKVSMEFHVRGKTINAINKAAVKVDRALESGATAIGAQTLITNLPGYLPMSNNKRLSRLFRRNLSRLIGEENIRPGRHSGGTSDMGDVTHIMPAIHPFLGGFKGNNHTPDFEVADEEMAYIIPAKCMAMTIVDLLSNEACLAKEIKDEFVPAVSKQEYTSFVRKLSSY